MKLVQSCRRPTATSIDAIQSMRTNAAESKPAARIQQAELIARALYMNMTRWFEPTADNFFGRVSKAQPFPP